MRPVYNLVRTVLLMVSVFFAHPASSASEDIYLPFNASRYTQGELRLIQLGLTLEQKYNGILDGKWGRRSAQAISDFAANENGAEPQDLHAALLAYRASVFLDDGGWKMTYQSTLGFSLLWSPKLVEGTHTGNFLNYSLVGSSLGVSVHFGDVESTSHVHAYVEDFATARSDLYKVRNRRAIVTSGTNASGKSLYARSNFLDGMWGTLLLSAEARDKTTLAAMTASISENRYASFRIPANGRLLEIVDELGRDPENEQTVLPTRPPPSQSAQEAKTSYGSGFFVSKAGHILTNAHVIRDCRSLHVNDQEANLVAQSSNFDLALLKIDYSPPVVAKFAQSLAKLNEDVTVVGYPLADLLGGINVTRGAISATTGLGGDETTMQISAPVQPGNSGGPVLALNGSVVGVVVSKLDAALVQREIGDIPQNINFAIRGSAATLFLSLNGVEPVFSQSEGNLESTELAERATKFTVQVICNAP